MRGLLLVLVAVSIASAQVNPSYLLRLDHSTFEDHSCALLQSTGAFHLEVYYGDDVKVFEGTIQKSNLPQIERALNANALANLSKDQIQEPLMRTQHDELQVTVFRGGHWQDLFFQSSDSQQDFAQSLRPLVRWLDRLHKLPHRELSEDEGKNNCLPRKVIALKSRVSDLPVPTSTDLVTPKTTPHVLYAGPAPQPQPQLPAQPPPVSALLRVYSFEKKSDSAHESCALVGNDGRYRSEDRTQKAGKSVNTNVFTGQMASAGLQQLHQLLDDPKLQKIKHHEPPGHAPVSMMGDILDISISHASAIQQFILSSRFNRPDFPSARLDPGQTYRHISLYRFSAN
jgi:hypothetical protein